MPVLGVVLGQRQGSLLEAALLSAERLGDSAAEALRVETVLPAGAAVLSATSPDGRRAAAVTAAPVQQIGWGGLELPVKVLVRSPATKLRAGEQLATVVVDGARVAFTGALATRSIGGASFGWRLRHLF